MCDYRYKRHLVDKKDPVLKELIELCEQAFINSVLSFNCVLMEAGSIYCDVFIARLFIYGSYRYYRVPAALLVSVMRKMFQPRSSSLCSTVRKLTCWLALLASS